MKAVFFDRDDTLIIDKPYMSDPRDLQYFPETREALKIIQDKGYELFIVSNQSGIGRGMFTKADAERIFKKMQNDMLSWRLKPYKEIVYCPHAPEENCDCRKPSPKLINELIKKWSIDRDESFMVGDKISDVKAGELAGLKSYLVGNLESLKFKTFKNCLEFSHYIS